MTRIDTTSSINTQYTTQEVNNQQGVDPSRGRTVLETQPMTKKEFTKQFFKLLFSFRYKQLHNLCKAHHTGKQHQVTNNTNTIPQETKSQIQNLNQTIGKPTSSPITTTQPAPQQKLAEISPEQKPIQTEPKPEKTLKPNPTSVEIKTPSVPNPPQTEDQIKVAAEGNKPVETPKTESQPTTPQSSVPPPPPPPSGITSSASQPAEPALGMPPPPPPPPPPPSSMPAGVPPPAAQPTGGQSRSFLNDINNDGIQLKKTPPTGNLLSDIRAEHKLKHVTPNENKKPIAQGNDITTMLRNGVKNMPNYEDDEDNDINTNNTNDEQWNDDDFQNEIQSQFQQKSTEIPTEPKPIQAEPKPEKTPKVNTHTQGTPSIPVETPKTDPKTTTNQGSVPPPPPPGMSGAGMPPPPPSAPALNVPQPTAQPVAKPNMGNIFAEIQARGAQRMENSVPTSSEDGKINLDTLGKMRNTEPAVAGWERASNKEEQTLSLLNKLIKNEKPNINPKMIEWLNNFIDENELGMKTDSLSKEDIKTLQNKLNAVITEAQDDDDFNDDEWDS